MEGQACVQQLQPLVPRVISNSCSDIIFEVKPIQMGLRMVSIVDILQLTQV